MYTSSLKTHSITLIDTQAHNALELSENLQVEGYRVVSYNETEQPFSASSFEEPSLIIISQNEPVPESYAILSEIRKHDSTIPVIMISDSCDESDKLRAFRLGVDDYLERPFGFMELLARIDALCRRSQAHSKSIISTGNLSINLSDRTVHKNDEEISLTPLEFELLKALIQKNGVVVARQELLKTVWGHKANVTTRTIDTHIFELRNKLETNKSKPELILTVPKIGYRIKLDI